jgi:hypothetical protein
MRKHMNQRIIIYYLKKNQKYCPKFKHYSPFDIYVYKLVCTLRCSSQPYNLAISLSRCMLPVISKKPEAVTMYFILAAYSRFR